MPHVNVLIPPHIPLCMDACVFAFVHVYVHGCVCLHASVFETCSVTLDGGCVAQSDVIEYSPRPHSPWLWISDNIRGPC